MKVAVTSCVLICVALSLGSQVSGQQTGGRKELPPEIGELGQKLKTPMTIVATTLEGPFKGFEDGTNIRVKKIAGVGTQALIQMPVWEKFAVAGTAALLLGKTYELRGYESGEFIGGSDGEIIQTTGRYFRNEFVVLEAKVTKAIEWAPSDFIDREALIVGVARNESGKAIIDGRDWKLVLGDVTPWQPWQTGKQAETFGTINKSDVDQKYIATQCSKRLVNLKDQIGRPVTLRGTARSKNGSWWFNYRGTNVYVVGMGFNYHQTAQWSKVEHWQPIELNGTLELGKVPAKQNIFLPSELQRDQCYVVKDASWKPINGLLELETPPAH